VHVYTTLSNRVHAPRHGSGFTAGSDRRGRERDQERARRRGVQEYAELGGLDPEVGLRLASGFGGGLGCLGDTCGAVSGAVMAIGLLLSSPDPRDQVARMRTYDAVQSFIREFSARHETTSCRELLGCDISTPDGLLEARSLGLMETRCVAYVRDAVDILETMVLTSAG